MKKQLKGIHIRTSDPVPAIGQIWQDATRQQDKRFVLVKFVGRENVEIITCDVKGQPIEGRKPGYAKLERFGRSGGYKYIGG